MKEVFNKNAVIFSFFGMIFFLPFKLILSPIFLSLFFIFSFRCRKKQQRLKELFFPIAYFILGLLSLIYTNNFSSGLDKVIMSVPIMLIPLGLYLHPLSKNHINSVFKVIILSCILFCLYAYGQLFIAILQNKDQIHHYNFFQRNLYSYHFPYDVLWLNIASILMLNSSFRTYTKGLIIFFFSFYIILAGTRVGILTLGLIWAFLFLRIVPKIGLFRVVIIASLLILATTFTASQSRYVKNKVLDSFHSIGLFQKIPTEQHSKKYHNFNLRATLWGAALTTAKESIFFGHGQGSEEQLITEIARPELNQNINSHNQYLSTLVNTGLLGLMLLLLWILSPVHRILKTKNYHLLAIIMILFASMFTESFLCRQKGVFIITILITLIQLKTSARNI